MPEKALLRSKIKKERLEFRRAGKSGADEGIFCNLVSLAEYRESGLILCYVSVRGEVDTGRILQHALGLGKTVAVPRCEGDEMAFYAIRSLQDLVPGRFAIPEPCHCPRVRPEGGLCLLPGLCFDRRGNRLGYGKGYYDRFLAGYRGLTAGLCPSRFLFSESLPAEEHDRPVQMIVTENGVVRISPKQTDSPR